MEYKGKLYAKIGNKYLEISHTDEFESLEAKFQRLQDNIVEYQNEAEKMKVGLFARNQTIQTLDKEAMERRADNEDLEKENDDLRALVFSLEQQLEERNISIQALEKVRELVACLKDAAITCKEKNALKSGDASYWLGAENAYLQVVKSVEREFDNKGGDMVQASKEFYDNLNKE